MRHLIDFSYSLLFSLEIKMPHSFHLSHVLCIINLPSSALPEEFILLQWLKTSLNFLVSFYIIIIFFSLRHSFWSPWFQHPLQEALGKAGCRVVVLASCFPFVLGLFLAFLLGLSCSLRPLSSFLLSSVLQEFILHASWKMKWEVSILRSFMYKNVFNLSAYVTDTIFL